MTPITRKLDAVQRNLLNWNAERKVGSVINEKQVDDLLGQILSGDEVIVYDKPGEVGLAHALVDKVRNYTGSQRIDLLPLMDDEATLLGVKGGVGAFAIRVKV